MKSTRLLRKILEKSFPRIPESKGVRPDRDAMGGGGGRGWGPAHIFLSIFISGLICGQKSKNLALHDPQGSSSVEPTFFYHIDLFLYKLLPTAL